MVWISSPGSPKAQIMTTVVLERPGLRALRPEIKSYIVFFLEEVNLLYAHYLINSQSIPLKWGRGRTIFLYRWITWGSKRLSSLPRSHGAISTQLQLPGPRRQKATDTDRRLLSLKWRHSTWTTTEKRGPGQNYPNKLAYMPRFARWLTIFYSTWNCKQLGKAENRNEVTGLLFIGYQLPHSAAFQLKWI